MCSPGCHQKGFIKTDLVGCRYMLFRISWAQVQDLPQINYVDNRKGTLFSWLDYIYIYMALGLIGRDGGLSTLCQRCGFDCQQRVLKKFPSPGYLHSEDGIVWLWPSLVNLYIYIYIILYIYIYYIIYIYICVCVIYVAIYVYVYNSYNNNSNHRVSSASPPVYLSVHPSVRYSSQERVINFFWIARWWKTGIFKNSQSPFL